MQSARSTQPARERGAAPALAPAAVIRGAAVSVGPSLLLDLLAALGTLALATGRLSRPRSRLTRLLRPLLALGAAWPWLYLLVIRPWHRRWGATQEERQLPLPGDERVPEAGYEHTRAVTIYAPAEAVWPWLAQLGEGRGGFYSYDWLERLAGCDVHSADRIHPEWQDPRPGDTLPLLRGWGPKLLAVEPGRSLLIDGWGSYSLRPIDARTTRLLARARQPRGWGALSYLLTVEIPHFIMERRMLLGLKEWAERLANPSLLEQVLPEYDFGGRVEVTIQAPPAAIFRALREVTLAEMPLAYALGSLRYLPGRLTGRAPARPDEARRPFFELIAPLVLAEQPDHELVFGSIGRLHDLLDQQFVSIDSPEAFASFDHPDYEKLVESVRILGGNDQRGYTVVGEHRTRALGPSARWKFALYWYLLVGWSGNLLLRLLLEAVKRRAERQAAGFGLERADAS